MSANRTLKEIQQALMGRFDPEGKDLQLMDAIRKISQWIPEELLDSSTGITKKTIESLASDMDNWYSTVAKSHLYFGPWGWVASGQCPLTEYRMAAAMVDAGESRETVETFLVETWNTKRRLQLALQVLKSFGVGYEPSREIFSERWRLVAKALGHHEAGAYEASVPLILAQADGIVIDILGSKANAGLYDQAAKKSDSFQDQRTIAGMPEGLSQSLDELRAHVKNTTRSEGMSRHGTLHGRQLGYDTKINSTKAIVMLAAVVEWAQPRVAEHTAVMIEKQLSDNADRKGRGSNGKLMDRRGFKRAVDGLFNLNIRQFAELRRHGAFGDDLDAMFPGDSLSDDFLKGKSEVILRTNIDRTVYWAYRRVPTGAFLGISNSAEKFDQKFFVEMTPPTGDPDVDTRWTSANADFME